MRTPGWRWCKRCNMGCINMQSPTQLGAMTSILLINAG